MKKGGGEELVPKELVWEMSGPLPAGGHSRGRRGLEVPGRLLETFAAIGGNVSWEMLRKIALSRKVSRESVQASSRRGAIVQHTKYQNRLRRLKMENDMLSRQMELLCTKIQHLECQLKSEQRTNNEQRFLYSKIIQQTKDRRNVKTQTYAGDFVYETERLTKLLMELNHVKDLYMKQKLLTVSICDKYVKVREAKEKLWKRLSRMEEFYRRAMDEAMLEFDRDRMAFALIERDGKLRERTHAELVKRCSTLAFNNAALHMALLKARTTTTATNDVARDISMFSILKDTNNLARYEEKMNKLQTDQTESYEEQKADETRDKFIRIALLTGENGEDLENVPLFEVESEEDSRSEHEEDPKEREEVEVDCSFYSRSEDSEDFWKRRQSSSDLGYKSGSRESRPPARSMSSQLDSFLDSRKVLRSESAVEIKKAAQRKDSAPDIIQAVPTGFRIK